ncbi:hypothetical protein LX59_00162 [Azomonas agilis]|uniref:DUF721 domain-containing protein n=1 Tax=Azomonas agilis TaxID=116849 RepID=A0A562J293_9GAMM|nr:DciA family protein [Azomonas agilis]TWH77257.1 hypothetical protein LX59_00162 [Azomonas agilis]
MAHPLSFTPYTSTQSVLQTGSLQALFAQVQYLSHLQQHLDLLLEPAARDQCRVANFREGCLFLIIKDAAWATRLRYRQQKLIQSLGELREFAGLHQIVFKVSPDQQAIQPIQRSLPSLSSKAAVDLLETAAAIQDPQLRAALERLARHAKPSTG